MEKIENVVIGGGITAAIVSNFLMNNSLIISPEIGGQVNDILFKMHYTDRVQRFLKRNKINFDISRCTIGFYYNSAFHDVCSQHMLVEYYSKSRKHGVADVENRMDNVRPYFDYFRFDMKEFFDNTIFKEKILLQEVKEINIYEKTLITNDGVSISYEKLYVTIPLVDFFRITKCSSKHRFLDNELEYNSKLTFNSEIDYFNTGFNKQKRFDYVYFVEKSDPVLRMSYDRYETKIIYELVSSVIIQEKLRKIKYGYLVKHDSLNYMKNDLKKYYNINFFGRFAEWNDELLASDVVEKCYNMQII